MRTSPTPFPAPEHELRDTPDADEVLLLGRGILSAISVDHQPTPFQAVLTTAICLAMTGHPFDIAHYEPIDAEQFAHRLALRNEAFRSRIVQNMILGALVLRPLPTNVADNVAAFASAMSIDDGMLTVTHDFAAGQFGLAAVDFDRNGYTAGWSAERTLVLHTGGLAEAWATSVHDPALASRWCALEHFGRDTIGRRVWEFYRARGFEFPGLPGSAPPLLAQHDWVHVLGDYGTKVESELEVFGFIARANDDPRAFSLLAMVVSLFETGYLAHGAGLFDAFPGQLSHEGMAARLADAMRRGARSHGLDGAPDVDLLEVDWFALADRPLLEVREMFGIVDKAANAVAAGSVGPWEAGGISEYQFAAGQTAASSIGRIYESHGATP